MSLRQRSACACFAVPLASAMAAAATGHPLDTLEPGHWYEVPGSHLRDVCPPDDEGAGGYEWHYHCRNVMGAWSGGAYDSARERLVVWGGGHSDYAGNEVYVFDVETLAWSRLDDPSALAGFCDGSSCQPQAQVMPDGRPPLRHTYNSMVYVPTIDRLFAQGGSLWRSGNGTSWSWAYDFVTRSWSRKGDAPGLVYDPVLDRIVAWSGEPGVGLQTRDFYVLDLESRIWSRISPAPTNTVTPTAASDTGTFGRFQYLPERNAYLVVNDVDDNVFLYRLSPAGLSLFADGFESGDPSAWSAVEP